MAAIGRRGAVGAVRDLGAIALYRRAIAAGARAARKRI